MGSEKYVVYIVGDIDTAISQLLNLLKALKSAGLEKTGSEAFDNFWKTLRQAFAVQNWFEGTFGQLYKNVNKTWTEAVYVARYEEYGSVAKWYVEWLAVPGIFRDLSTGGWDVFMSLVNATAVQNGAAVVQVNT